MTTLNYKKDLTLLFYRQPRAALVHSIRGLVKRCLFPVNFLCAGLIQMDDFKFLPIIHPTNVHTLMLNRADNCVIDLENLTTCDLIYMI
jgi:hypothetical protein